MDPHQKKFKKYYAREGSTLPTKKDHHRKAPIKKREWGCQKWALLLVAIILVGGGNTELALAADCEQWVAKVVSVEGMIQVRSVGEATWGQGAIGDTYCVGDTVRVPQWRAALVLQNETLIRLDAGSEITFTEFKEDEPSWIELLKGMVHFLSRTPQRLTITTPFVNGAIEGTEFLFRVIENEAQLWVFEGRVVLENELGTLPVVSGQSAVTRKGEPPQRVIVVRPRDAVQWALYYPPLFDYRAARLAGPDSPTLLKATQRYEEGDVVGALSQLDNVPPARRDVHYFTLRAGMLLSIGRVDHAQADISEALQQDADNGIALALLSVIALVNNDTQEALRLAHRATERAPDSSIPHIALSYAQQGVFQIDEASASAQEATRLAPEDALALARVAELWLARGYSGQAIEAAYRAVERNATLSRPHTILGFAHLTTMEIDKASTAFQQAIALDQADPLPRLGLGLAKIKRSGWAQQNGLEPGRREIEIAMTLDPNNSILRSYLGKIYFEEKRGRLAETQYAMAKELDPHDPTPWFYDAIRKQLANQPIGALHDLQESIRLNDNRAVYRGRLLLDQDVAARGTTVGRTYNNLGFGQRGRIEGWHSLSRDPASPMAHRLLSDTYSALPRYGIARVSELLQSQLLQPLNTNNLQPQLPFSNLQIVEAGGPSSLSLNEFNPLFMRDGPRLLANTVGGSNDTYGGNVVGSILQGPVSLSAGAYGFNSEPDFRDNFDVKHEIYNVFAQAALLPQLNIQTEYRYRKTEQGDLILRFDPNNFSSGQRLTIHEKVARVGARFTPGPHSNIISSYIYSRTELDGFTPSMAGGPSIDGDGETKSHQVEGQYLFQSGIFNAQIGGGYNHVDTDIEFGLQALSIPFPPFCIPPIPIFAPPACSSTQKEKFTSKHANGYAYINVHWPQQIIWTGGFAYESIDDRSNDFDRVLPKAGMQWTMTDWARLRLSYVQTMKRPFLADQTIEPTQVAGFNQFFDDAPGTTTEQEGIALDLTLTKDLYAGFQLAHRELEWPTISNLETVYADRREDRALGYVYWTPHPQLAFTAEGSYERFKRSATDATVVLGEQPTKVETWVVPLSARFFHPSGFFAGIKGNFVWQQVDLPQNATFDDGTDDFFLVDADVGYRLPNRLGIISLEVHNLFDKSFHYQDLNEQTSQEAVTSPFLPTRMVFGRLTLSF